MAKNCPACGSDKYKKGSIDPDAIVIVKPRVCVECGRRYTVPLPRWVGLIAYVMAAVVVGWMLVDWFAPPSGWDISFTWWGRIAILAFAGMLVRMGALVLKGKTD